MLKVEGSNPGLAVLFRDFRFSREKAGIPEQECYCELIRDHATLIFGREAT